MSQVVYAVEPIPSGARVAGVFAKTALILLLVLALVYPDSGHLRDKAAGLRAVAYPALSFTVPALWWALWRDRVSFPWLPDLMVTVTCFSDVLGNRMDLYDSVVWFDDWMHFMNLALLTGAFVLLTMPRTSSAARIVERALAFGATSAIAWEIAEYFAFLSRSSEREFAYADTLGDLALGMVGAVAAAVVVRRLWASGYLEQVEPVTAHSTIDRRGSTIAG